MDPVYGSVLLILGFIIAVVFGKIFRKFWREKEIDKTLEKFGLPTEIIGISLRWILEIIIKFSIFLLFASESFNVLNLKTFKDFSISVLSFIPNILRIILLLYIGEFLTKRLEKTTEDLPYGHILYFIFSSIIFLFIGGIVLGQLGVKEASILLRILEIISWGISAGIAGAIVIVAYSYIRQFIQEK